MTSVVLRSVEDDDLPHFLANQLDEEANRMAAFTAKGPTDRAAFEQLPSPPEEQAGGHGKIVERSARLTIPNRGT